MIKGHLNKTCNTADQKHIKTKKEMKTSMGGYNSANDCSVFDFIDN